MRYTDDHGKPLRFCPNPSYPPVKRAVLAVLLAQRCEEASDFYAANDRAERTATLRARADRLYRFCHSLQVKP